MHKNIISSVFLLLTVVVVAEATTKTMKTVHTFCEMTPYREICVKTIEPVARNESSSTKDYLMAILEAASLEVKAGMKATNKTNIKRQDHFHKQAVRDCEEMLGYAVHELQAALTTVGDEDLHSLSDRADELLNWLAAVYSYQTYCIDEFHDPGYRSEVQTGLMNATQLTHNAVDVVAKITNLIKGFGGLFGDITKVGGGGSTASGVSSKPGVRRPRAGHHGEGSGPTHAEARASHQGATHTEARATHKGATHAEAQATHKGAPHAEAQATHRGATHAEAQATHKEASQKGHERSLKEVEESGHDEFPSWMESGQRKLLAAGAAPPTPNAVVAKDGTGKFKTVGEALAAYVAPPPGGRYVIYIKAGVYDEQVTVTQQQTNVYMYGDGVDKTIITGSKNFGIMHIQTSNTATVSAIGDGFMARGITFRNTAGPEGHQAVALRLQSDMAAVWDCNMEAYQDTLYYQVHRQFFTNCLISGTIDFIFGKGSAVIQNSKIVVRKGLPNQFNTVTADGKELQNANTGLVLQNCVIVAEAGLTPDVKNYLGRPWKAFAKTVVMQTDIGACISPEGYIIWDAEMFHQTCEYLEFANKGASGATDRRNFKDFVKSKVITSAEADKYTVTNFIQGNTWLPATGAPFTPGL